jgi:hypothetical protein
LRGLFGGYHGGFVFLPYHQLIKDYSDLEGRDIWELDLELTAPEIEKLLLYIYEFDANYIDYTFLNKNCAGILEFLIYQIKDESFAKPINIKPWRIPLESFKNIAAILKNKKYKYLPSLKTQLSNWEPRLTSKDKELIRTEKFTKEFSNLSPRALDYLLLEKKINSENDDTYYTQLLQARAKLPVDTDPEPASRLMPAAERSKTSLISVVGDEKDWGVDVELLTEKFIYGYSLSEINFLNFKLRTSDSKTYRLSEFQLFNFLAGEPIHFLKQPLSYGGGVNYKDEIGAGVYLNVGMLYKWRDWVYLPKIQTEGSKNNSKIFPAADLFYFHWSANYKMAVNPFEVSIEAQKTIDGLYGIHLKSLYSLEVNAYTHGISIGIFF